MIQIRKSDERGHANHGWLDSYHTFSFANYYDPRYTGFSDLLVINEDRVAPGMGFGAHGHRDMEIISYVLEGALEHKDNLGTTAVIRPGDVQRMSAGTGVMHSEYNHSARDPVHFFQIWIQPAQAGIAPGYEQKHFEDAETRNRLRVVASPDGRDGSVTIHQDTSLYAARIDAGQSVEQSLDPGRRFYVQVARGEVELNGKSLASGDGAALEQESHLTLKARENAEILLFDLA